MNTEEEARKLMTQKRRHEENLHENMVSRSNEEIENQDLVEIDEKARELVTNHRQHEEHIEENMLNRSNEEIH